MWTISLDIGIAARVRGSHDDDMQREPVDDLSYGRIKKCGTLDVGFFEWLENHAEVAETAGDDLDDANCVMNRNFATGPHFGPGLDQG